MHKEEKNICPTHGHQPKFSGSASIGERGQIVIPADLRAQFDIKAGDKFIFFSMGKTINLMKADDAKEMLDNLSNMMTLREEIENAIK